MQPEDWWLVFTKQGIDINKYPAIKLYLEANRERLEPKPKDWPSNKKWSGRKFGRYKWYEIQDTIAYWQEFETAKIIIPAIQVSPQAARDTGNFYTNNKASIFVSNKTSYLLGIINSSVSTWFASQTFSTKQGGFFDFEPRYSSTFIIPFSNPDQEHSFNALVPIIEMVTDPRFEQLLNGLVYELFFPDDLHEQNIHLFDACSRAGLEQLAGLESENLQVAAKEFLKKHLSAGSPIRIMLSDLQSIEVVRIIEEDK